MGDVRGMRVHRMVSVGVLLLLVSSVAAHRGSVPAGAEESGVPCEVGTDDAALEFGFDGDDDATQPFVATNTGGFGGATGTALGTLVTDTPSGEGKALKLEGGTGLIGSTDGVRVDAGALHYGTAFSIEAWVKPSTLIGQRMIYDDYGNPGVLLSVGGAAGDEVLVGISTEEDPGYPGAYVLGEGVQVDRWHHLAGVYDGTELRLYLDGVLLGSAPTSGSVQEIPDQTVPIAIGKNNNLVASPEFFEGELDDVRMYGRALSAGEVAHHAGICIPEPGGACGEPGSPRISVGDASVVEGNAGPDRTVKIPVTLFAPSATEVSVTYTVSEGSATSPEDFTAKIDVPRVLKFKPSTGTGLTPTTKFVSVKVEPELATEGDETFTVELSSPTGGYVLGRSVGIGTIIDDDLVSGQHASLSASSICEGDVAAKGNTIPVSVTLAEPAAVQHTVSVVVESGGADAGTDFKAFRKPVTVTFKPGQIQKVISLKALVDLAAEEDEDIRMEATGATVPMLTGRNITQPVILDDD